VTRKRAHHLWRRFINPDYIDVLETIGFGRCFVRAEGMKLYDDEGNEYLDFLAGFGVHNIGHNHPRVLKALQGALESHSPSMLNADAPIQAGLLAERLSSLMDPRLCRAAFTNSGAEAVDVAIKAARAATGRKALVSCANAYHGLSCGGLSLMGRGDIKRPFGKMLDHVEHIPFNDIPALKDVCSRLRPAAFFSEPIQGEGGIVLPDPSYLKEAGQICKSFGALLVVDEIQTGFGRTGDVFASDFSAMRPDIVLVGKSLSAGLIPVAAAVMTTKVWKDAFSGPRRCLMNASTFAGGHLAMTAGLEMINVLVDDRLSDRARELGGFFLERLKELSVRHRVIRQVRGSGLLIGIEFQPHSGLAMKAVPEWAHEGLFAHVISALLLRDHRILTFPCSIAPNVLRIEPPLIVTRTEIMQFLDALDKALSICPSHGVAVLAALRQKILGKLP